MAKVRYVDFRKLDPKLTCDRFCDFHRIILPANESCKRLRIDRVGQFGFMVFSSLTRHLRLVALGHFRAVGVEDRRRVGENGAVEAQGALQGDMFGGVGQVLLAADDVGDLHQSVVHDHG